MKMITNFISLCICLVMLSCGKDDPKAAEFRFTEQVVVDGISRTYIIKLPQNYYQNDSTRAMVIGLHGTGGSADQFEKAYGFNQKADQAGFVAVYPDGVQKQDGLGLLKVRTWNAGTCCDFAMYTNVNDVKFIGLSHGNESGDYLHDITKTTSTSILQTWRLGKLIIKEKNMFAKLLDGVITISDNETYIDQWLGAQNILFLPRILEPHFIDWQPQTNTMGFVGTLNHLPNIAGIELLANQLQLNGFTGKFKVAGTPANIGHELEKKYPCITYCGVLNNEQLKQEISTWCLFLNPVFWYSRGSSTKLSQGINWGLPVVTTPAGMRGYDLADNSCVTFDNSPAAVAQMALQALSSTAYLNELKQATENNVIGFNADAWASKLSLFLNAL